MCPALLPRCDKYIIYHICPALLPRCDNPIAVNKYIISYIKFVHLVGFISSIYHDIRSSECQNAHRRSAVTEVSNTAIHSKEYRNILALH